MNISSIKHYIIIRFYCFNMMENEKLFDYNLLHDGVNVFKHYTLKSLENQTNKNFEILFMIHNDISDDHAAIVELKSIKSNININVVHYKDVNEFINKNDNKYDFLITTRIDHDDLIYSDAVKEIQNKCNINIPLYYNGYVNGITMINNNFNDCYKFYPKYNKGSISIFQSLIVNKKIFNKNLNIYSLGQHNKQLDTFIDLYKNYKYNESYFNINNLEDAYIYVKHDFNHSSLVNPGFNENWHRTNIKVDKSKEWFIERFGNFIDN